VQPADGLGINAHQNISLMNVGRRSGPLAVYAHDHEAEAAIFDCYCLQAEAEIAARNAPMRLETRRYAVDRSRRYHKDASARPEHGHTESLAGTVDGKATLGCAPQGSIELDACVDFAAAHRLPGPAADGDHAESCGRCAGLGPDGKSERSGQRRRRRQRSGLQVGAFDFEQGDGGARITPDDAGIRALAAGQRHANVAFLGESFVRRDDKSATPDETGRTHAMGKDRHEAGR